MAWPVRTILFFIFFLPSLLWAATPEPPAQPQNYVVDLANVIADDVEAQLNGYLRELEQKTTAQVVVLTVESLDGEPIEQFSLKVAERWKIGQKGKDNGVLITTAVRDRKYRFEIGYGLEPILPDSLVGSIGRDHLVPHFRKGDYSGGLNSATLAVANTIADHQGVTITGMPAAQRQPPASGEGEGGSLFETIVGVIIFLVAAYFFIRNPGLFLLFLLTPSRRGGSGWSGGGGFGGGDSGGFSGGGGSFGGGGASGDW